MSEVFESALADALRRLKSADRFESEIRDALAKYDEETIQQVVDLLRQKRVLDDRRLVTALVERNTGRSAVGPLRLRAKLEARGAPPSEIDEALASTTEFESDNANALLSARFPGKIESDRARAGRFLLSRGFDVDLIESVVDRYFS